MPTRLLPSAGPRSDERPDRAYGAGDRRRERYRGSVCTCARGPRSVGHHRRRRRGLRPRNWPTRSVECPGRSIFSTSVRWRVSVSTSTSWSTTRAYRPSTRSSSSSRTGPVDARIDGRGAVPSDPRRSPAHVRRGVRASNQHLVRARLAGLGVQGRLRDGQACAGGPLQGNGVGGRSTRCDQQLRQPGLCANAVGFQQIADQARTHDIPEQEVLERVLLSESAIKRLVEPEEVASLVGWLASADAGMVTGASYTMDGGWSAR